VIYSVIVSRDNATIKYAASLLTRKGREKESRFLIEGRKLVAEALSCSELVDHILIAEGNDELDLENSESYHGPITRIAARLGRIISDTESPQGVWAICRKPDWGDLLSGTARHGLLLLLAGIQDPGNLGAILRTGWAVGADAALLSAGTADVYNPKVVRSAMGATFHFPVYNDINVQELRALKKSGYRMLALQVPGEQSLFHTRLEAKTILVLGNEGRGIPAEFMDLADTSIEIPIERGVESLNVAVACGVVLYEWFRQNRVG
jgi:TrmH family RNA methyltransferase